MGFFQNLIKPKNKLNTKAEELGAIDSVTLFHDNGLPIGHNEICQVFLCKDKIIICSAGYEFNIKLNQISESSILNSNQVTHKIKSSIGKAIVGGTLLGSTGAIIGGMPETKEKTMLIHHLAINYKSNKGELENVILNSGYDLNTIKRFSQKINELLPNKNTVIDL
ncbi:hypothetical protein [Clostridium tetani]|uniref:hypothetical protein n=1 Tax=Clostridium tetani TaxID=1513 RepID=UPI002952CE48|nr:hypothetical protein [Clostridium tetani]